MVVGIDGRGSSEPNVGEEELGLPAGEYVRFLRLAAGLETAEVARRAGVTEEWLSGFEAGRLVEDPTYDLLLSLVRATQPPRPEWWDSGHEHDLNLPSDAVWNRERHPDYWKKIDQVRALNRKARGA